MNENKPWYLSKTIWATVVTLLAAVLPTVAQMGTGETTDDVTKIAAGAAAVVAGVVAIYGRYKATKAIGKK